MKKILNFYCISIFVLVAYLIVSSFVSHVEFNLNPEEKERGEKAFISASSQVSVTFSLKSKYPANTYVDSVYNAVTEQWIPMKHREVEVALGDIPQNKMLYPAIPVIICFLAGGFLILYSFIKLIYNINKERIFEWKNVKLLRRIGITMCIIFLVQAVSGYWLASYIETMVQIPGYVMDNDDIFEYIYLVLGVISLVVGEVFAIGLRMKEEQELTI